MAAPFKSHKVGDRNQDSATSARPYYVAPVVKPTTYRPHSHYNRESQAQMQKDLIIMSESNVMNST